MTKSKSFDLSSLEVPDTAEIHIEHPVVGELFADMDARTGPVVIEMYGPASDQAIKYRRKVMGEAQSIVAKKGAKGVLSRTPEETERREVERLVALTAGVKNLEYNGEGISVDTIFKVYSDPKMGWLVDQVKIKTAGWDDFLAA